LLVLDSSMLIHCPTCATSYEVKANSLGAAGRSVRCVRCRTVWFANARPPEPVVATGQRIASAHPAGPKEAFQSEDPSEPVHATADQGEFQAESAAMADSAAGRVEDLDDNQPMLDPGARALAMDRAAVAVDHVPSAASVDIYEPITMADAPPLAPMDHDASKIPAEPPMLTGVANTVDVFVARRAARAALPAPRSFPISGLRAGILALAVVITGLLGWRANVVQAMPQMASLYAMIGLPVNLRGLEFNEIRTLQEMHDGVQVLVIEGTIANITRSSLEIPRLRFAMLNANGGEVYTWTALPSRSILASGDKLGFRTRLASPPPDGRDVVVRFYSRRDAAGGSH
jgi:predicted Zn finger-like uncharacterized protein